MLPWLAGYLVLNKAYDEDYVNDREFNAGRKILTHLIDTNKKAVAIFMVRYYGGVHLGNRHIEIQERVRIT